MVRLSFRMNRQQSVISAYFLKIPPLFSLLKIILMFLFSVSDTSLILFQIHSRSDRGDKCCCFIVKLYGYNFITAFKQMRCFDTMIYDLNDFYLMIYNCNWDSDNWAFSIIEMLESNNYAQFVFFSCCILYKLSFGMQ